MKRAGEAGEGDKVAAAIAATELDTMVGPIAWDGAKLPPFAAQEHLPRRRWSAASGG